MSEHFPAPWHVDPLSASIYAIEVRKGPARVADMRGWGYLTGKGHGALALSENEAIDIQRANAAFIVEAVNSHDALVEALHEARMALFKIRACSIVGCEQGYGKPELWADALFASHGDVAKALKTIDAALPQPASVVGVVQKP